VPAVWLDCPAFPTELRPAAEQADRDCSGPVERGDAIPTSPPPFHPANAAFRETMFGFAEGTALASVFYGRIEHFARDVHRDETEIPVILGHVMAHEIGHLLLGSASHSKTGIMCGQWDRNYLRRALIGRQLFTPEQIERIQAEVPRRIQGSQVPTQR